MSTFKSQLISHVNIIQCPRSIDKMAMVDFAKLAADWTKLDVKLHVFDFKDVTTINNTAYRAIAQFKQGLTEKGYCLFSIHMAASIYDQIKSEGMEGIFAPINSVKEALEKAGLVGDASKANTNAPAPSMTVEFLGPFISAVLATITTMSGTKVTSLKPKPIENKSELKIDIGSTISMSNVAVKGRVGLYFSEEVFKAIYLKITKEKDFQLGKNSLDLVRELLNIAFGKAKTDWNNLGYSFKREMPESLLGEKLTQHKKEFMPEAVLIPFETPEGTFYMGISMAKIGSKGPISFQG